MLPIFLLMIEHSNEEFKEILKEWRSRYAVNGLAVYPRWDQLKFFEDKKVTYLPGRVRLEDLHGLDT